MQLTKVFLVYFILLGLAFSGRSQSDSVQNISDVTVRAFQLNVDWLKAPSSVGTMDSTQLRLKHGLSPAEVFNNVPGVLFESRGVDGSRRISIRGSSLRSAFGVRNVKMYWNGIPITSPDGSTGMEIMDVGLIDHVEIIKGPGASLYGGGMGGVILAESKPKKNSVSLGTTLGSWGTVRGRLIANLAGKKGGVKIGVVLGESSGYRQQEFNGKQQYFVAGNWKLNKANKLFGLFNYYEGNWGLPGALDSAQVADDPRQAVNFALDNNTRVSRKRIRAALGHEWKFKGLELKNAVYWNQTTKENPFGTSVFFNGYKDEAGSGAGGRSSLQLRTHLGQFQLKPIVGVEYQFDRNTVQEFALIDGVRGEQKYSVQTNSTSLVVFADVQVNFKNWLLTVGASYNQLNYASSGLKDDLLQKQSFSPIVAPRFSLARTFFKTFSGFGSYGRGYSPPTIWDLTLVDGSLNTNLQPELGDNFELGVKYRLARYIRTQLTGFFLKMENAIVAEQLPTLGFELRNSGETQQTGVELSIKIDSLLKGSWNYRMQVSYVFSDYRFTKYVDEGDNFSGNIFPGIPTHRATVVAELQFPFGMYVSANARYSDRVFMNSENSTQHPAYILLSAKLGYQMLMFEHLGIDVYVLSDNLSNTSYSSFIQLNGFGGRYYNPSSERSFYAGLQVSWDF